jgi:hypothetical protein
VRVVLRRFGGFADLPCQIGIEIGGELRITELCGDAVTVRMTVLSVSGEAIDVSRSGLMAKPSTTEPRSTGALVSMTALSRSSASWESKYSNASASSPVVSSAEPTSPTGILPQDLPPRDSKKCNTERGKYGRYQRELGLIETL